MGVRARASLPGFGVKPALPVRGSLRCSGLNNPFLESFRPCESGTQAGIAIAGSGVFALDSAMRLPWRAERPSTLEHPLSVATQATDVPVAPHSGDGSHWARWVEAPAAGRFLRPHGKTGIVPVTHWQGGASGPGLPMVRTARSAAGQPGASSPMDAQARASPPICSACTSCNPQLTAVSPG